MKIFHHTEALDQSERSIVGAGPMRGEYSQVPGYLTLETFPTDLTRDSVDMAAVDFHHVELQCSVSEEVFTTAGADVLHD